MALPSFNHPAMQAEPIVHQSIDSFIGAHAEMTTDQWSQASSSNNTTKYTVFDDNIVAFDSLEFGMRSAIDYDYGLALKELERDLSDSDMAFMAKWDSLKLDNPVPARSPLEDIPGLATIVSNNTSLEPTEARNPNYLDFNTTPDDIDDSFDPFGDFLGNDPPKRTVCEESTLVPVSNALREEERAGQGRHGDRDIDIDIDHTTEVPEQDNFVLQTAATPKTTSEHGINFDFKFNPDFDVSELIANASKQVTVNPQGQVVADNFDSYNFDLDGYLSDGLEELLASVFGSSVDDQDQVHSAAQFAALPVVTIARPVPVAPPVLDLFTSPYPEPTPQHLSRFREGFNEIFQVGGIATLPAELKLRILQYALKADHVLLINEKGQVESKSAEMRSLLFLAHQTPTAWAELFYTQNTFVCTHAKSMINVIRQRVAIKNHIFHLDLAVDLISHARMIEIARLKGVKTLRFIGVKHYWYRSPRTGFNISIKDDATNGGRMQEVEDAIQVTLNTPATKSKHGAARFFAGQPAVKKMKMRGVLFTFVARYNAYTTKPYKTMKYETAFKIDIANGGTGYVLTMETDELLN